VSGYQLPVWIWPAALLSVCALAIWRGRDDERFAAGGLLAGWALTMMVFKNRSYDTQWAMMLVDGAEFAVLLWIAMKSRRYWPLFASAYALLQVLAHMAHAAEPDLNAWAYITATIGCSYLILFTIAYGAWTSPRWMRMAADPPIPATG
jgi:hypothetical protein